MYHIRPHAQATASVKVVSPGPPDVQPNILPRVFVELIGVADPGTASSGIYGHSLDHSSPLSISSKSIPSLLAARLAEGGVLVNTWARGVTLSPQTLTDAEAIVVTSAVRRELARMLADGSFSLAKL
jgi:hypothetical protein